jgi:tetratricopeptide (TPR) repeat protein
MSDPLRTDPLGAPEAEPDRNAKIEQLLLVGLDHYFAAEYEHAINVWSRALFLDRSHARARAYIERARSALAERQRESEELLQKGLAAFRRGDGDEARRLLEAAINQGAPRDEALAVLDRLSRLEHGAIPPRPVEPRVAEGLPPLPQGQARVRRRGVGVALSAVVAVLVAAAGMFISAARLPADWPFPFGLQQTGAHQVPPVTSAVESSFPVPLRGETAVARARALAAGGHLHDALAVLGSVRSTDRQKAEADQMRADIQRQLIGLASLPEPGSSGRRSVGGPLP